MDPKDANPKDKKLSPNQLDRIEAKLDKVLETLVPKPVPQIKK